ncbi:MAG TPA: hypothetical protein VKT27_09060 [Candidatus Binataceae bacterium]|nr:hypothetical protein [Candidatus Binataceae bacterium]
MNRTVRLAVDGAVAGIIGAIVIGLWYLIFDAAGGQPLGSLGALAATVVGAEAGGAAILLRFILHFGIFVAIGVLGAMMFATAETNDALFPTMIVLVPVFEIFSIMLLMLIGPSRSVSMPWWKFIIGDAMATFAMIAYFLERHPILAHHLEGAWTGVAREGAFAGVVGALVVAVWFLICDSITGGVLRTPAVLGAAIFQGMFDPERVQVTLPLVLGYTALHFFAFILFGIATAVLLYAAEYEPVFAVAVIFLLAIFELFFVGALAAFDEAALAAIGFWRILVGNVLAIAAMLAYFETRHRGWLPRFRERWDVLQLRRSQN